MTAKLSRPASRIMAFMNREAEEAGQTHYTTEDLREIVIGSGRSAGTTAVQQLLLCGYVVRTGEWFCLSSKGAA